MLRHSDAYAGRVPPSSKSREGVADEITGGRFDRICDEGGSEEKRMRLLAEQKVRRDEIRRSLPTRRVQRALPHKKHAAIVGQVSDRT
jgi:hypothetical protein